MNMVFRYRCDYCQSLYHSEKRAKACESSHANPVSVQSGMKIVDLSVATHNKGSKYPETVKVMMDDGAEVEYCLQSEGGQ